MAAEGAESEDEAGADATGKLRSSPNCCQVWAGAVAADEEPAKGDGVGLRTRSRGDAFTTAPAGAADLDWVAGARAAAVAAGAWATQGGKLFSGAGAADVAGAEAAEAGAAICCDRGGGSGYLPR